MPHGRFGGLVMPPVTKAPTPDMRQIRTISPRSADA
jgi:hypothetical protein